MKRAVQISFLISILSIVLISGCSKDTSSKAIDELTKNQKNNISVHVFINKTIDKSFEKLLNQKINNINNRFLGDKGITNISIVDVREKNKYDYEKIFNLSDYPQILLFQNKDLPESVK